LHKIPLENQIIHNAAFHPTEYRIRQLHTSRVSEYQNIDLFRRIWDRSDFEIVFEEGLKIV
jgi:hypothetical protein